MESDKKSGNPVVVGIITGIFAILGTYITVSFQFRHELVRYTSGHKSASGVVTNGKVEARGYVFVGASNSVYRLELIEGPSIEVFGGNPDIPDNSFDLAVGDSLDIEGQKIWFRIKINRKEPDGTDLTSTVKYTLLK